MAQELYSKFGITWYGDESEDELDRSDDQLRDLMCRVIALHDKMYGYVALRVVMLGGIKLVYDNENHKALIGDDTQVFPGPTPLFSSVGAAPELYYNPKVMSWVKSLLVKELKTLEAKYAAYILALDKLATNGSTGFTVSTE